MGRESLPNTAKYPYCSIKGLFKTIELIGDQEEIPLINKRTLRSSGIEPGSEHRIVSALRLLGLTDEDGIFKERASFLRKGGERLTVGLREMVYDAYGEPLVEIASSNDNPRQAVNKFIREAGMPKESAVKAERLFIALCVKAEIITKPPRMWPTTRRVISPPPLFSLAILVNNGLTEEELRKLEAFEARVRRAYTRAFGRRPRPFLRIAGPVVTITDVIGKTEEELSQRIREFANPSETT